MSKRLSIVLVLCMLLALLPVQVASAQPAAAEVTPDWILPGNCAYLLNEPGVIKEAACAPLDGNPNPDLVIFAHGYMRPSVAVGTIPADQMVIETVDISNIVTGLGYAFATTSYRRNGLVVVEALDDILALIDHYTAFLALRGAPPPPHIYLIGASEGGLITTLSIERHPEVYTGGLALCGPVGDFRQQINYWGDFRVLFDYFFKGQNILPPTAVNIPVAFYNAWWQTDLPLAVAAQIGAPANQANLSQLIKVSKAPINPADPTSLLKTTMGLLDYNINATNNGVEVLGGNPYDNRFKRYTGSTNDGKLNSHAGVVRYTASPEALANLAPYQTSGKLTKPLITMHTTGDEIVPYWHEPLYTTKTLLKGSFLQHINIPIVRYGHCNFKASEVLVGFTLLKYKATGTPILGAEKVLPQSMRGEYLEKAKDLQAVP